MLTYLKEMFASRKAYKKSLTQSEITRIKTDFNWKSFIGSFYVSLAYALFNFVYMFILLFVEKQTFASYDLQVTVGVLIFTFAYSVFSYVMLPKIKADILKYRILNSIFWGCLGFAYSYRTFESIHNSNFGVLIPFIILLLLYVCVSRAKPELNILFAGGLLLAQLGVCFYAQYVQHVTVTTVIWVQIVFYILIFAFAEYFIFLLLMNAYVSNMRLEQSSNHDYLTGLLNRRGYIKELQELKLGSSVVTAIIDIDFFKLYNDKFGHREGDQALVKICNCIKEEFRDGIVVRWGGEEMLVVLVDKCEEEIHTRFNDLLKKIPSLGLKTELIDGVDCLTVSIGIAQDKIEALPFEDDGVVRHADSALYEAKESGRNRIVYYSPKRQKNEK